MSNHRTAQAAGESASPAPPHQSIPHPAPVGPAPSAPPVDDSTPREARIVELPAALRVSDSLRRFVDLVGRTGSWLFVPMLLITVWDIVARKLRWEGADGVMTGIQIWLIDNVGTIFESTKLQELEWHFHTALWALVLGYGYIWNTHVRVDLLREHLAFRKKAWLEFLGITLFLIPYTAIVIWFASEYAFDSWVVSEQSSSTVGLTDRWIIKSVLVLGLIVACIAGVAVWLQVVMILWGPQDIRFPLMTIEWPEEEGSKIEGKERLDLQRAEDQLEVKARELAQKAGQRGDPG